MSPDTVPELLPAGGLHHLEGISDRDLTNKHGELLGFMIGFMWFYLNLNISIYDRVLCGFILLNKKWIQEPTELWKKIVSICRRRLSMIGKLRTFFFHNYCFHNLLFFSIILSVTVCPSIRNLNAF